MDIQQLKLILDTINSLGEAGKEAFFFWLLADKIFPGVVWAIIISILGRFAYKTIVFLSPPQANVIQLKDEQQIYEDIRSLWLRTYSSEQSQKYHELYQLAKKVMKGIKE